MKAETKKELINEFKLLQTVLTNNSLSLSNQLEFLQDIIVNKTLQKSLIDHVSEHIQELEKVCMNKELEEKIDEQLKNITTKVDSLLSRVEEIEKETAVLWEASIKAISSES